ncbi:amino acid transporter [Hysterangium stoloniferum]|nr:amino acid transporter [Hysterangium stoloniferum]
MPSRSIPRGSQRQTEDSQPLLEQVERDDVIFSVGGDDDDEENEGVPANGHIQSRIDDRALPLPLRSMVQSRETEYELDTDDLENTVTSQSHPSRERNDDGQSMPLLVGLIDSAHARTASSEGTGFGLLSRQGGLDENDDIDIEELTAKTHAGGGLLDSIANMANSILGAGIIGLPYAVRQAGFFTGIILMVVLCAVTDWTIRLIVVNAKMSGRNSYIAIMDHCFGGSGRAAVSFFQFAMAFGGMCAFGIIIGDTIPHVIQSLFPTLHSIPVLSLFTSRQFVVAFCTLTVSYPLSLYRDIHKLSRASGLALVGMIIIVTSVIIEGAKVTPELRGSSAASVRFSIITPRITEAIGVISFAFVCHHNSLLIYGGMRTPTLNRFAFVTHVSTALSLVACLLLAISAFLVFTDKTRGNILNNFSQSDTLINVARFCFGLNMFTTFPLELFVCREVIEQYFFSHETFSTQRHVLFTTAITVAAMFIALITCDLGVMLEITGGVSATALAYIFPAACYLKLLPATVPWTSRTKLPAVLCAVFGFVVMILSLVLALGKVWTREGDAKICI